ncbi:hypothetical protein ASG57_34435 [Bradyrhizobium sp. Leaf396]|nr:hypothetical protein ASG57_34435 [Bradyrhizobium sp. Leaf396]
MDSILDKPIGSLRRFADQDFGQLPVSRSARHVQDIAYERLFTVLSGHERSRLLMRNPEIARMTSVLAPQN